MMNILSDFDFDFSGTDRKTLLAEANQKMSAFDSVLGDTDQESTVIKTAAAHLLEQLDEEVAEFSVFPEVLSLRAEDFTKHKLAVPQRFEELSGQHQFYWIRFPITLKPAEGMHFNKLKCAVEFNPGVPEDHLRPCAQMILPDKKFRQLLELSDSLSIKIGENFEFEAAHPDVPVEVEIGAAGKLGFMVGPFKYTLKRAQLDHSGSGTEKVFWTLDGVEFFQEDDPTLIVVLRVPKGVDQVKIAGALQAYHGFNLLAATMGETISYLGKRLANFFRKGAPIQDLQEWDITPNL
jgi:hypothetical protein